MTLKDFAHVVVLLLLTWYLHKHIGGRSGQRHTGCRTQGQIANGQLDGRQVLHDVRQRGVLGTGAAHGGAENPRRVSTADGHGRGRHNPVADRRAGHRG